MRHDSHLLGGARPTVDEEAARGLRHDDHELCLAANVGEDECLMRCRLGENRVQGHDEGLRQLSRQRCNVVTVPAAEDPVLVLQEDDVDVEPTQDPGRTNVVAAHTLRNRCDEARPLGSRRLVHDHDLLDPVDVVEAEESAAHVGREGADAAGTRRVGGDDGGAHAGPRPFRRGSGAARERQRSRVSPSLAEKPDEPGLRREGRRRARAGCPTGRSRGTGAAPGSRPRRAT